MRGDCYPYPTGGVPLLLNIAGLGVMVGSILAGSTYLMLIGLVLFLSSQGRGIEPERKRLRYVFGSVELGDVVEVARLSEMERGRILTMAKAFGTTPVALTAFLMAFVTKGAPYTELLAVYAYWLVLYLEIFIFPLKELKKKKLSLTILPILLSLPLLAFSSLKTLPVTLLTWLFGSFLLNELLNRDLVVVRTEKESYLVSCANGELIVGLIRYGGIMEAKG
ncbi:hypothetical protein [Thermococcus peptonophilus]|uniref:Uncharacterized protein n=1 Tax=Thermococcus peptonophilus TaxID=53952 RepID=A0A142CUN4_9EURY|nr:hypothetical protein [Thermococcus peptonophilus]AMQ18486.1 hypothetical protein A0127_04530 [Thermococcus peptonophilus]